MLTVIATIPAQVSFRYKPNIARHTMWCDEHLLNNFIAFFYLLNTNDVYVSIEKWLTKEVTKCFINIFLLWFQYVQIRLSFALSGLKNPASLKFSMVCVVRHPALSLCSGIILNLSHSEACVQWNTSNWDTSIEMSHRPTGTWDQTKLLLNVLCSESMFVMDVEII